MSTLGDTEHLSGSLLRTSKAAAWLSLASACAAWAFDAMDLQIFTLVLFPSVSELVQSTNPGVVAQAGGLIVACKLVALGLGGIAFGIAADRIGRARTMIITVLIYSIFTGLSGLAQDWWQLLILQACAGIGIGGEWAAGAALVAETWPERTRARALVIMQMSFAIGFFLAALLNLIIGPIGWRYVFAAGAAPALMTLLVRMTVPEPQRWLAARRQAHSIGGLRDSAIQMFLTLFVPPIRRRTIVGVLIASAMMIGAFGAATLLPIWIRSLVGPDNAVLAVAATSQCFMLINVGAVLGYLTLIWLTDAIGRRWSYFLVFADIRLLCRGRVRQLRNLPSRTVSDPHSRQRPGSLLECRPHSHRRRPARRRCDRGCIRLSARRWRCADRHLFHRSRGHLVWARDAGSATAGLSLPGWEVRHAAASWTYPDHRRGHCRPQPVSRSASTRN